MSRNYREKIQMKFNISQLDKTILALINNPTNKRFITNVKNLFDQFISDSYQNDGEKEFRVYMIRRLADIILKNNINEKADVLNYVNFDGKYENSINELLNSLFEEEVSDTDMVLIDKQISQQLKYGLIGSRADKIAEMLTDYQTENYDDVEEFMDAFENEMVGFNRNLVEARESMGEEKNDVSLCSHNFLNNLKQLIDTQRNPSSKVRTGIQALNEILNGGFERSRTYCALGMAKGWKSGFLLNSCIWAMQYNELKSKDPTKRPVILYLSQENTIQETIERIWAHCFGNDSKIGDYEPSEAARMLEERKIFTPNDPNRPELILMFRPNRSISTADIDVIIDDLLKQGKEVVFLVQDYLKRLRPAVPSKELRIELSNVTNELATIAKVRDIPILTAMQLNRESFRAFDEADSISGQVAAVDKLGSANVGESIDIIQNVDMAFVLARGFQEQLEPDGEVASVDKYLLFKLVACRSKQPKYTSFQHRFMENNDMRLIEDVNSPYPLSVKGIQSLVTQKVKGGGQVTKGKRQVL